MNLTNAERRHAFGWLMLPVLAVFNGLVRDTMYADAMGRDLSHSISVVPLLVLILAWSMFLARRWPLPNRGVALRVGLLWLALTLMFEFGLGFLQGLTMAAMLGEYDITRGRIWPLVPVTTAVAPELMRRLAGRRSPNA